jgi:ABC-type branched-subunit amino acid transport system ATPase component/branched-subunit amino acid ABC-type transport system permease component
LQLSDFLVFLISGFVAGAIYSVFAAGLTLLYSATGIYNFAYGAISFVGGLLFFEISNGYMPRWAAFLLSVLVFAPLLGLALERLAFRRLARVPEVQRLLGTVGLVVGLPALGYAIVNVLRNSAHLGLADPKSAYEVAGIGPEPAKTFRILGSGTVNSDQLAVLIVTAVVVVALWLLITKTRVGLQTRAVVDRSDLASARGIDPSFTSRVAWVLGTVLAVMAGILSGPLFGLSANTALQFVVASSAVVVIARFRSLPVAMIGGLLLGALSSLFAGYGTDIPGLKQALVAVPGLTSSVVYLALLGALLWRGIQRGRVAGVSAIVDAMPPDYTSGLPTWRRWWPWTALSAVLLLWATAVVPFGHLQAGAFERTLIIQGLALAIVFLSFVVVVGMLGVASLAQAAFVTAGGLAAGLWAHHHWLGGSFVVDIVAGGLASALLALIVALPALRLGGLALALATLALAFIGDQILFQINALTNHREGWHVTRPAIGGLHFSNDTAYILLLFAILLAGIWLVSNFQKSATGRSIMAVRFSPPGAASVGLSNRRAILAAFAVTGLVAGVGGVLLAYGAGTASATDYPTQTGLLWITIAVLWGVRRPASAVLAGMTGPFLARILATGFWHLIPRVTDPTVPSILFGLTCLALSHQPDGALVDISARAAAVRDRFSRQRHGEPAAVPASPASQIETISRVEESHRTPDAALRISGVTAGYGLADVLHGIDLEVPPRSIVAVLGPNGTGKSTLCGVVAGTVPLRTGQIWLDGEEIGRLPAHARTRRGLLLAPESRGIFPALTVEENLAVLLSSVEERERAFEQFPQLAVRRRTTAANLSGGEQQILCLAPLLVHPPKFLIADELTLGLAPTIVTHVLGVLRGVRDAGATILMVEEKARHVLGLADYCAFLSLGRLTAFGAMDQFSDEVAAETYLGGGESTTGSVLLRHGAGLTASTEGDSP